jgi:hypothetical protein
MTVWLDGPLTYAGWYPPHLEACPFCAISPDRVTLETEYVIALGDGYPVAQSHTLVVPRRLVLVPSGVFWLMLNLSVA